MQDIHLTSPYRFVPPKHGTLIPEIMRFLLPTYLNRVWGLENVEVVGAEKLQSSLHHGCGVMIAPNHCRPCDPMVIGALASAAGCYLYIMASAHLFYTSRFQRWLLPRVGAFSIFREGMDRTALETATQILVDGARPLVIFPEGVVSRTNDRLNPLMEGAQIMLRSAAKKRVEAGRKAPVVVHPVALRYFFHGNLSQALQPTLDDLEKRLTWLPQSAMSPEERVRKLGLALLSLKEIEQFGRSQEGAIAERVEKLVCSSLDPIETEWLKTPQKGSVIARVKKLRAAILPDLVKGELSESEKEHRWRQLTTIYYAQQMSFYPANYLGPDAPQEHLLETVERFEEDITDVARIYRPMSVRIQVGDALEVSPEKEKGVSVVQKIEDEILRMLQSSLKNPVSLPRESSSEPLSGPSSTQTNS